MNLQEMLKVTSLHLEQDEMALVTKCLKCGGEWKQNEHGRWVNKHDPDTFYEENFK